jgi:RimJ/RimL family protein N-acetyltransferase
MKITIKEATINDAKILFDWANDPVTRQNSFNSKAISWNDHILWLNKKLINPTSKIYIVHFNEKPVGVVRFDENETTIIGITVAPDHRNMGLGSQILIYACKKFWENNNTDILAYVKKENISSQHVFEKAGFSFLRNDIVNQNPCLILKAIKC